MIRCKGGGKRRLYEVMLAGMPPEAKVRTLDTLATLGVDSFRPNGAP
jgi:hypothetical protein